MKWILGSLRPGLVGLAVLFCALVAPAAAQAAPSISVMPVGAITFSDQDITFGTAQQETVTVTSTGAGSNLIVGAVAITGSSAYSKVIDNCTGNSLATGASCQVIVAFNPASVGTHSATLSIPSNVGVTITRSLSGIGTAAPAFSPNTSNHVFSPSVDVFAGESGDGFFRITNAGSAAMTFSAVSLIGPDAADFFIPAGEDHCTGTTVAVSTYCDVIARFNPSAVGAKQAALKFDYTYAGGSGSATITLNGTGVAAKFSPSAAALSFGSQSVEAGAVTQSLTVSNIGNHPLTINDAELQGAGAGQFAIANTAANTCDNGDVAIGASCVLPVEFDPSESGAASATLRLDHNDPSTTPTGGQSTITLTGTGTQSQATASSSSLQFEPHDIFAGPSTADTVTITNTGSETLAVNSAAITGAMADEYAITGGSCTQSPPKTLAIGEACTYTVIFDPADDAEGRLATLEVTHTGINSPTTVELAGLGLRPQLSIFPAEMQFEQRFTGSGASAPQWTRFENFGSGPLTLGEQSIVGAGAADYSIYFNDCANRTLVPSEFCDVAISFDPQSAGAKNAVLRMTHAPLPMTVSDVPLAGIAIAPPPLKLTVSSPKRLRLRTTKSITYSVKCPATCTVTANANLLLPGKGKKRKRSTLGWKQVTVQAGKTGKLTFKLTGLQQYALTYAARDHKKISVSATFSAWADGYSEAASTRGFKLK